MWILKRRILSFQLEKIKDFDYQEEYLRSVSNKIIWQRYEKHIPICELQIDEKINNIKEDPRRKTDSNFDFSQVA